MGVRIASVAASGYCIKIFISLVLILSFWTTDVSSFKEGARISLFLAHSLCNYTENEVAKYLVQNERNFTENGIEVGPKYYDGTGGYIKKTSANEYNITATGGNPGRTWNYGLRCYVGTCAQNYQEQNRYARCVAAYDKERPSQLYGFQKNPGCQDTEFGRCSCYKCSQNLCNSPSQVSCKPPHPGCSTPPPPPPPPPIPTTTTTTTTTTTPSPTFAPGPTLTPPKFSCYVAESCDEEATLEASPDFPECVIANMKDGTKKFNMQTESQGFCDAEAEKCDFCYISKCNDPKKKCKP